MSRTAAIIQSRMGSTRCPNKAVLPLEGRPLTEHIIRRVQATGIFDAIVLAIPDTPADNELATLAEYCGIDCVRGPENDVLKRFVLAADTVNADHVLRVCGDNPLVDLELMSALFYAHHRQEADYTISRDPIPLGTGTEMVRVSSLKQIMTATREPRYREHVTTWFHDHATEFNIVHIPAPWYIRNLPLRLTVDTPRDYELIAHLYARFYKESLHRVELEDAIHYLGQNPHLSAYNADVPQKDWRTES